MDRFKNWLNLSLVLWVFTLQTTTVLAEGLLETKVSPARLKTVVFMSGGTIDDNAASVLLATIPDIKLKTIQISNSDTLYQYAIQNQWKIQTFIGSPQVKVGLSKARAFNPFPWEYRNDGYLVWKSSILNTIADRPDWPPYPPGDQLLRNRLAQAYRAKQKLTVLATAPLTPLANLLKQNPHLKGAIRRLIWMGGAINVPGNLDPDTIPPEIANPKAEWNAFWDPFAVDWIFKNTSFPITLFPLDVTDEAKLDPQFLKDLAAQSPSYKYSALVSSLYGLVQGEPYFEMWNTLTASYLGRPDIFEAPTPMRLNIVTEGYWQGTISQAPEGGRKVEVIFNVSNPESFYEYVLTQLRRN